MNLGIVIGVTNYKSDLNDLPACRSDASAIAAILQTESKFSDVLVILDRTDAGIVKSQLTEFISKHKGKDIGDVVFYFSGHGEFTGGEFHYLLSDFDPKRRKQTSLENSEVDRLLRSLSPDVAVKLVDACHSGITYVKDPDAFDNYLKGSGGTFTKCYFLFSSRSDQFSYQDNELSFFTRALVDSVLTHGDVNLRYKDVIDFVSDTFAGRSDQTPFFVTQADYTETFCTVSEALRNALQSRVGNSSGVAPPLAATDLSKKLVNLVEADAERYCTAEEATACLNSLYRQVESFQHLAEACELFEITVQKVEDSTDLPTAEAIGKWLETAKDQYFAEPYRQIVKVRKRVRKNPFELLYVVDDTAYKYVDAEENRVHGFRPTADMPFLYIRLDAEPRFPNLSAHECYFVPVFSKTTLQLFTAFSRLRDVGWSRRENRGKVSWETRSCDLKDTEKVNEAITNVIRQFWQSTLDPIREALRGANAVDGEERKDVRVGEDSSDEAE